MSSLTSKGQVTIPKAIRDKFGLKTGDRVDFKIENGKVILTFHKGTILNAIRKPGKAESSKKQEV